MPILETSFFIPSTTSIPYLLEDIYFKGGLRVVTDATTRDAIKVQARKVGMLVITSSDNKVWQLQADKVTFAEFKSGGGGQTYIGEAPISVLVNGNITIDSQYIIPKGGVTGDFLVKDSSSNPVWKSVNLEGISGNRVLGTWIADNTIDPLEHVDFFLAMSNTILLLELTADIPQVKVEIYCSELRDEPNPYTFVSTNLNLSDNGMTEQLDGSLLKGRRFNILANLEKPSSNKLYWRVTNLAAVPTKPTINFTYLTLQ